MREFDHWRVPVNLCITVQIQSALDVPKLDAFAAVWHQLKSGIVRRLSFGSCLSPRTEQRHQRLSDCELRELIMRADLAKAGQNLTPFDAECLALIAGQRGLGEHVVAV